MFWDAIGPSGRACLGAKRVGTPILEGRAFGALAPVCAAWDHELLGHPWLKRLELSPGDVLEAWQTLSCLERQLCGLLHLSAYLASKP